MFLVNFAILQFKELDITATDLSKECLMEVLTKIQSIRWLSAGQLDGMTDAVFKVFRLSYYFISNYYTQIGKTVY